MATDRVIAGVVVAVATVPDIPALVTTDAVVTVPVAIFPEPSIEVLFTVLKSVPETAAATAVPFPTRTPVMVVDRVMAGVVVAVATLPANPFAVMTDTLVTVPEPDAVSVRIL